MASEDTALLERARGAHSRDELRDIYSQWAGSYDEDLRTSGHDYVAPSFVANTALDILGARANSAETAILDAGCGTGLVGAALAKTESAAALDGLDYSPDMLHLAEAVGAYRNLFLGDLTREVEQPTASYDIVTCVGTFTHGHVGPDPALREFIRLLKPGGHVVATIQEDIWEPQGFPAEVKKLQEEGLVELVSADREHYLKGRDHAYVLILRKIGSV